MPKYTVNIYIPYAFGPRKPPWKNEGFKEETVGSHGWIHVDDMASNESVAGLVEGWGPEDLQIHMKHLYSKRETLWIMPNPM